MCGEVPSMFFRLILENGHVGAGNSFETVRYFKADNPVDMFNIASQIPRVKSKYGGNGVKLVERISREEYRKGIRENRQHPYLRTRKKKSSRKKKETLFH
jgi:hypothetical protein